MHHILRNVHCNLSRNFKVRLSRHLVKEPLLALHTYVKKSVELGDERETVKIAEQLQNPTFLIHTILLLHVPLLLYF